MDVFVILCEKICIGFLMETFGKSTHSVVDFVWQELVCVCVCVFASMMLYLKKENSHLINISDVINNILLPELIRFAEENVNDLVRPLPPT